MFLPEVAVDVILFPFLTRRVLHKLPLSTNLRRNNQRPIDYLPFAIDRFFIMATASIDFACCRAGETVHSCVTTQ